MLNQTRGVPSLAGRPMAPALCQSRPSMTWLKGRPQWPAMTPSVPAASISNAYTRPGVEAKMKRLVSVVPP